MTFPFGHRDSADTEGEAIQRLHRSLRTLWCGLQWTFGGGGCGDACEFTVLKYVEMVFLLEKLFGGFKKRRWVGLISKEGGVCIFKSGGCVFIYASLILSRIGYMLIVSFKADCLTICTDRGSSEWSFPWRARDLEFQGFSGCSRTLGKYLLNVEALKNLHEFWVPKSAKNTKHGTDPFVANRFLGKIVTLHLRYAGGVGRKSTSTWICQILQKFSAVSPQKIQNKTF